MRAHVFTPENRLAKVLSNLEGCTPDELVDAAQARVARLEAAIRLYVSDKVKLIMAFASMGEETLFAECRELGAHALDVAEVAGSAGLEAIGDVARGLSAMVESLVGSGVWHTDALQLHLEALTLLSQRVGASPAEDEVVLNRLRQLREAIGVAE